MILFVDDTFSYIIKPFITIYILHNYLPKITITIELLLKKYYKQTIKVFTITHFDILIIKIRLYLNYVTNKCY